MEAKLLEGEVFAASIREEIKASVQELQSAGKPPPCLVALQSGKNSASDWYVNQQEKLATKLGINFKKNMPGEITTQDALLRKIKEAEQASDVHGIFLAMPFPKDFDVKKIVRNLDPTKDVEGIAPGSLGLIMLRQAVLIPPTAYAALSLIESTGITLKGKQAVVIGQSAIVGRPLLMLLGDRRVTSTLCNTGTSEAFLEKTVSESDIVVACAGQPGLVKGTWIKPGAIVIDVGTTEVDGKLVGDVEFEEAKKRAGFITPVPGGVGPLTVTMLMRNLIKAYQWQEAETWIAEL